MVLVLLNAMLLVCVFRAHMLADEVLKSTFRVRHAASLGDMLALIICC